MHKTTWKNYAKAGLRDNFKANSLDSLANSSQSDDSQESDYGGGDTGKTGPFQVKCEVYSQDVCGSTR